MKTVRRHCANCGEPRPFDKEGLSHGLHLILTIVTGGAWGFVWLILIILNMFKSYRCRTCGLASK